MILKSLKIERFKGFKSAQIDFGPLTVIVGPNSGGKTSILEAAQLLGTSFYEKAIPGKLIAESGRPGSLVHYDMDSIDSDFCLSGEMLIPQRRETENSDSKASDVFLCWQLACASAENARHVQIRLRVGSAENKHWSDSSFATGSISFIDVTPAWIGAIGIAGLAQDSVQQARVIHVDISPTSAAEPVPLKHQTIRLQNDGHGLAAALFELAANSREKFERISSRLNSILPGIGIPKTTMLPDNKALLVLKNDQGREVIASELSEGTLFLLSVLTLIEQTDGDRTLLLIDDIDKGLHPRAHEQLIEILRELTSRGLAQVICTTHSPYLLDYFNYDDVRLTHRKEDGSMGIARLDAHPDYESFNESLDPGQFWVSVGEDWAMKLGEPARVK